MPQVRIIKIAERIAVTLVVSRDEANPWTATGAIPQRHIDNVQAHQHQVNAVPGHPEVFILAIVIIVILIVLVVWIIRRARLAVLL